MTAYVERDTGDARGVHDWDTEDVGKDVEWWDTVDMGMADEVDADVEMAGVGVAEDV